MSGVASEKLVKNCQGKTAKGELCKRKVVADCGYCKSHLSQWNGMKCADSMNLTKEEWKQEESSMEEEDCPVCTDPLSKKDVIEGCHHRVHIDCIIKSGKDECPLCRGPVHLKATQRKKLERIQRKYKKEEIREETRQVREMHAFFRNAPPPPMEEEPYIPEYLRGSERPAGITVDRRGEDTSVFFPADIVGQIPMHPEERERFFMNLAILSSLIIDAMENSGTPQEEFDRALENVLRSAEN
jgi:hypothetical protein